MAGKRSKIKIEQNKHEVAYTILKENNKTPLIVFSILKKQPLKWSLKRCQSTFCFSQLTLLEHLFMCRTCISHCPLGHYENMSSHRCGRCYKGCEKCVGPLPGDCLSCRTGLYLNTLNSSCTNTCPPTYFADEGEYNIHTVDQGFLGFYLTSYRYRTSRFLYTDWDFCMQLRDGVWSVMTPVLRVSDWWTNVLPAAKATGK